MSKLILKEIREDIKNKSFKTAIQKCQEVLENDPENYMVLVFLGACYQENNKKEAAKHLRKAVSCGSDPTVALQGLLNCAEIDELPDIIKKLLKLTPQKYIEYHTKLASLSSYSKTLEICIEILENEISLNEEDFKERVESAWKTLAKIFIKQNEIPEKWQKLFENALSYASDDEKSEDYVQCTKRYLKLCYKLQKFDDLLKKACKLHENYPEDIYPLEWICKVFNENQQLQSHLNKSIQYYCDKILNLNENSTLGLYTKAILSIRNEDYVTAYILLYKIQILEPNNINALKLLGKIYMILGAYGMALQIWKKLKITDIQYVKCLSHSTFKNDLEEAISIIEKKFNNENKDNTKILIRTYFNLNEIEKAQKILLKNKEHYDNDEILLLEAEFFMEPKHATEELEKLSKDIFFVNFLKAKKYFETKDYEKALDNILIATRQRPYYSECFLILGQIYFTCKDMTRARKCYEKCISLNPQNQTAITNLNIIYHKNNENDLIENLLENAVNNLEKTKSEWALFQLGLHYLSVKKFDKAVYSIQAVRHLDLNNIIYLEVLADAYKQRGSYNSAMRVCENILQLDSSNLIAKYQIATIKTILRLYGEAIKLFDEILIEHPNFIPALKGITDAHHDLAKKLYSWRLLGRCKDHLQKAVDHLQKVFSICKKDTIWLWRMMAHIFTMVARLPKSKAKLNVFGKLAGREEDVVEIERKELFSFAEKFYIIALKLSQNDYLLWYELALFYYYYGIFEADETMKLNHFKLAIDACKQAISYKPKRWENWNLLGVICAREEVNNLSLSQHFFIKALNIDKRMAPTWSNLGTLYLLVQQIKLSNLAFSKALKSNPSYKNVWIGQAMIARQIGEDEESMDLLRHSTQLGFHIESAVGYAYWVCSVLSDPEKIKRKSYQYAIEKMHAIPLALDSITWYFNAKEDDSTVEALSYLGYLNFRQCLWKSAIKAYQYAVKNAKDSNQKDQMLCNLGYMLLKNNQANDAVKIFMELNEANLESVIGLAISQSKCGNVEESYSVYQQALDWLAQSDKDKSKILIQMSAILYSVEGEAATKQVLYQLLPLSDIPIEALYFACALGIIHKDWELTEAVLDDLKKKYENNVKYCHHIAFLTAYYYSGIKQPRKGLIHLLERIHIFPDQPLLRKSLAEYMLTHSSKTKKHMHSAASQIAQSFLPLGLIRRLTSLEAAKALTIASVTSGYVDMNKQRLLAQRAVHLNPTCKEAWISLEQSSSLCKIARTN